MVIAVNCRLLLKNKLEGIGWFTYQTLQRITHDHPEHRFIFIFDRPYDPSFIFSDNITPVIAGPPTRHPVLWFFWLEFVIPRILLKYKADVFFSPDGFLSLRTKVRSIPVIHDISFAHRPKDLPFLVRTYYNFFFPRFARKAYRICTVSLFSQKDIIKTYGIARPIIRVVYNGVNEAYKPIADKEIREVRNQYSEGLPYFLYVGSLHARKNVDNLLEGYRQFTDRTGLQVNMVLVGTRMWTSPNPLLGKEGAGGSGGNVVYTGRLEPAELHRVMGGALALTFVPWYEGFGIPVVEAMASGVPVLTSDVTSLPEVGGNAVIYANPGSVDDIAKGMERLATDDELRYRLIVNGLERNKMFTWDKTARKVWLSIDTVLKALRDYPGR
ncbi:MAG: glycosyltransferase family 1 protein [Bacteroidales bacterium]|jgi:glycosyltransferase involved in cell wall biosynthesis